jgi:hypothetical protein
LKFKLAKLLGTARARPEFTGKMRLQVWTGSAKNGMKLKPIVNRMMGSKVVI